MKPTADQLARGLAAAFDLKDNGPGNGKFPVSFTKNPHIYVERIAQAVLEDVPEPEQSRG